MVINYSYIFLKIRHTFTACLQWGHAWLSDIGLVNCMSVCLSTHPHEQTNFKIQKIALWRCSWILVTKDKVWKRNLPIWLLLMVKKCSRKYYHQNRYNSVHYYYSVSFSRWLCFLSEVSSGLVETRRYRKILLCYSAPACNFMLENWANYLSLC